MKIVNDLVSNTPIPRMIPIRQRFPDEHINDILDYLSSSLHAAVGFAGTIKPGMRVALTAGSRGIANIALIIKTIAEEVYNLGAVPFVVPAMGSHGGATARGQVEVLSSYGITEAYIGCPIIASMETAVIGYTQEGRPVQIDKHAAESDGIIVINRVKPHTSFSGSYESGLMKMMAIGLAKQAGADVCHREGYAKMAENITKYGKAILEFANILFGVAIIENAYDQTRDIIVVSGDQIPVCETELLVRAKSLMPRIFFKNIDVLIVDKMGKNISGLGMDPHVTGCFASPYASGPVRPDKLVVLDLTCETHGNGTGIGVADITTRRLFDAFDAEMSYANVLTATLTQAIKIPMVMDNQELAIKAAIKTAAGFDKTNIRMVRLRDTLHVSNIWISEAMAKEAKDNPNIEILGPPEKLTFNGNGNLFESLI